MGALAQGQRFGVTLFVDRTLQLKLKELGNYPVLSFVGSMLASGVGELLANPPVVVKNFQIAHGKNTWGAASTIYRVNGFQGFGRGVLAGVARKSLANGIVLQSIGPTKAFLAPYCLTTTGSAAQEGPQSMLQKMGIGFVAGSITGSFAEVATNYPDRIKTLMQTKNVSLYDAGLEAARDPFRGALWAGLRKGLIRGINWGSLGLYTTLVEDAYVRYFSPVSTWKWGD